MPAFAADADAFGIVAAMTKGRRAAGADPFVAALVPALLLGQPLLERRHDLVPRSERLDLGHLFGGQISLGHLAQPFLGDRSSGVAQVGDDALEHFGEDLVEAVELPLVVNEHGAREIIELLGFLRDHFGIDRFEQQQMLLQAGRNSSAAKRVDKIDEHGVFLTARPELVERCPSTSLRTRGV